MIFPNFKRLWFNTKNFVTKGQKGYMNVHDALVNELVELGAITKDPCCDCKCGYNLQVLSWGSPRNVESIVIDGVTYTIGLTADQWSEVADILSNLGFGKFSLYILDGFVQEVICAPKNSHTFGTLTINDGETGVNFELQCPIVIID